MSEYLVIVEKVVEPTEDNKYPSNLQIYSQLIPSSFLDLQGIIKAANNRFISSVLMSNEAVESFKGLNKISYKKGKK